MADVTVVATNRRARHDYVIEETLEAGLVLTGTEVKSLRRGRASLSEAFVSFNGGEAWLENAYIPEYGEGTWTNHPPRRKRKLLLHEEEITSLSVDSREKGTTVIALRLYFVKGKAKVEIALARGKKLYDKRQALRKKEDEREARKAMSPRTRP
jgi:SsrA-binding protein